MSHGIICVDQSFVVKNSDVSCVTVFDLDIRLEQSENENPAREKLTLTRSVTNLWLGDEE